MRPRPRANPLAPSLASIGASEGNRSGWRFDHADCGINGNFTDTYSREGGNYTRFEHDALRLMRPVSFYLDGLHLRTRGVAVSKVTGVSAAEQKTRPSEQALIDLPQTPPQTPPQKLSLQPYEFDSQGYVVSLQPSKPILLDQSGTGPRPAHQMRQGEWTSAASVLLLFT